MPEGIGNRKLSKLEVILNKIWHKNGFFERVDLIDLVTSGKGCRKLA